MRKEFEEQGLFEASWTFFFGMLAHIFLLEAAAYYSIKVLGNSWPVYLLAVALLATAQAQAGWLQHDYGHLSVFKKSKWNHWMHYIVICHIKGASRAWWNWRHFEHHAKPNVVRKDPDITFPNLFLLGDHLTRKWAKAKKGVMPYNKQHIYWWAFPPLLLPVYFHVDNVRYVFQHKHWWDLFWIATFFAKHFTLYGPLMGGWGAFWFYMLVRTVESHWFTWVTQMNHIPMHVDNDRELDWPTLQGLATCNVEGGLFNDWFTGHLNYQIEHHLFPTMPRHNYSVANKKVQALYKKHGVPMQTKGLIEAFADIIKSLEHYGGVWKEAYYG